MALGEHSQAAVVDPVVTRVSAAEDGAVWALDGGGALLRRIGSTDTWRARPGEVTGIAIAADGTVYAVGTAGDLLRFDGAWVSLGAPPGAVLRAVSVAGTDMVWATDQDGGVHWHETSGARWHRVDLDGFTVRQVCAGSDGTVFCVTAEGIVLRRAGDGWAKVDATEAVITIGVAAGGLLWAVAASGSIARYGQQSGGWEPVNGLPGDEPAELACGDDPTAWALGTSGTPYAYDPVTRKWTAVSGQGRLAHIAAGGQGRVWALTVDDEVFEYVPDAGLWSTVDVPGRVSSISAQDASAVWAVDASGEVRVIEAAGAGWAASPRPSGPVTVSAAPDGSAWGVDPAGAVLVYDGDGASWRPVSSPPAQAGRVVEVSATADAVFALCEDGTIYHRGRQDDSWTAWGDGAAERFVTLSAPAGGALYAVGESGRLWLHLGRWGVCGDELASVSVADVTDVWGVGRDGRVVRFAPRFCGHAHVFAPIAPGWDAENPFDETQSTHLWLANRAARQAGTKGELGALVKTLIDPGAGRTGKPFHDNFCQGLFDADWLGPYNGPPYHFEPSYAAHFYDPANGQNWQGDTSWTALTQGAAHFEQSVVAYQRGEISAAGYHLGLSMHFLTDLTQPMHAANLTWLSSHPTLGYHSDYEIYIMQIQSTIPLGPYTEHDLGDDPRTYLIRAARNSRQFISVVWPQSVNLSYNGMTSALRQAARDTAPQVMTKAVDIASRYLLAWVRQAARPWQDHGLPPQVTRLTLNVGATTYDDRPYMFARGGDGNMWVRWYTGSEWLWATHHAPTGTVIDGALAVTTYRPGPTAYVLGANGHVYADSWSGKAWSWIDQGTPPGTAVAEAVGAIGDDTASLFVRGADGNLYVAYTPVNEWLRWGNPGQPLAGGAGVVRLAGYALVAAYTSDGALWCRTWGGHDWRWFPMNRPPGTIVASRIGVAATTDAAHSYVVGGDGHVWRCAWNPTANSPSWADLGTPGDEGGVTGLGAVEILGTTYAFVRGRRSGVLWVGWLDDGTPRWVDQGAPPTGAPNPVLPARIGLTVAGNRPFTFAIGIDYRLWLRAKAYPAGVWQPWQPIRADKPPANFSAPLTAVWRDEEHLDIFAIGPQAVVSTNSWERPDNWPGWNPIQPDQHMTAGARVAAVWRTPLHLDLFTTAYDGTVYTTSQEAEGPYRTWVPVSSGKLASGADITALWRPTADGRPPDVKGHLDLFGLAADGTVLTAWWELGRGWTTWLPVAQGPTAGRNGRVEGRWRDPAHLDLFVTGTDGTVLTAWWEPGRGWTTWYEVPAGNPRKMTAGAGVTALWRDAGRLDLFVSGPNPARPGSTVWSVTWSPAGGWGAWYVPSADQSLTQGAPIAALWRDHGHRLDLLTTAPSGHYADVWTATWTPTAGWQPWQPIHAGSNPAGATAGVIATAGADRLFAFTTASGGTVNYTFWEPPVTDS
ncbi:MAG TPA: tectonin domain-containing protein [Trebonia sp.]|jgi:hypothetical protein|nr:tectonin domain-containing protein [Trebonia sp.]